jgi:hypothetical protein
MTQNKIIEYLKKHVPNFKHNLRGNTPMFTCPYCGEMSCRFIPGTAKVDCMACKNQGDIVDIAKALGNTDATETDEQIQDKLYISLNVDTKVKKEVLDFYFNSGWDLVPLTRNSKIPYEQDWPNKEHTRPAEWDIWLKTGLNFGVKCGKKSQITIIDVDQETIPPEIDAIKGNPLIQKTPRGWHLIYKYTELPTTRIEEYKTDILNNGKQCVIYPSIVDDQPRNYVTPLTLTEIPPGFQKLLTDKLTPTSRANDEDKDNAPQIDENFKVNIEDLTLKNDNLDGCCNTTFLQLGGILRKQLSTQDAGFVLKVLNKHLLEKPMDVKRVDNIIKSLEKYSVFEEKDLLAAIFKYLKIVEFANAREIKDALGFKKESIDKALAHLAKEQQVIKKGRNFYAIKRANWKEGLNLSSVVLDFKVPYFDNCANLAWGDMLLLGSKSKYGKTTIAMNIIKSLAEQGKKSYYISLEAGSRFTQTALALGLREGDFKWDFVSDPTKITLEDNAITILDWLLIEDKAMTDSVMKYFIEQLYKTQGFLIAFVQLKETGDYFAPNMIKQFPALAARYLYTGDGSGIDGEWILDAIRDPKIHMKSGKIPCQYDWKEKRLRTLEEIQEAKNKNII